MHIKWTKDWYSGSASYKRIDKLIKSKSKYLLVSTPYIDNHYLKILNNVARKKKVKLVSSRTSEKKIRKFMRNRSRKFALGFFFAYLALIILWFIGSGNIESNPAIYLPLVIAALIIVLSKGKRLKVRIIGNEFVHEKLYITEKMVIVGSANMTYAGTHKNVEHIEIIQDGKKIKDIRKHFDKLWDSGKW